MYFCRHLSEVPLPLLKLELDELQATSPAVAITGSAATASAAGSRMQMTASSAMPAAPRSDLPVDPSLAATPVILTPTFLRRPCRLAPATTLHGEN